MGILKLLDGMSATATGAAGAVSDGFRLHVDVLEDWLVRIALVPEAGLDVDRTWMVAPGATAENDGPLEGRDRLSVEGFSCPDSAVSGEAIETEHLRVTVEQNPLRLGVYQQDKDGWQPLFLDRENGAYQWFEKANRLKHFQRLNVNEAHYGLGDKTGPMDRTGRRLRCLQSDALGYNAETSDPLYKHAPWIIVQGKGGTCGLLYDTMAETTFDLGAEHSNYFERFRHVEMSEKGMVLYVVTEERVRDVVPRLHHLTGRPAFPPRWSMGFAFTSMHHADSANGQEVIGSFAREARARDCPMSAIHFGSGYTGGDDGLRYVFNWNEKRFPDRAALFAELRAMGFRTCANVKPVLLTGHVSFDDAQAGGWFVQWADGKGAVERFWDGFGCSLDFTNRDGFAWWQEGITKQVLQAGFNAVWNDNNECELWDEDATVNGFDARLPGMEARPVHALLMTRASHEAMRRHAPDERPYTISRAGPIGIGRYGETWSGDNYSNWHTLKWNLRQGLSMALSGMPLVGHDVGGFVGPPPEPELLVRWFQMMALHPRCVMNSWKADYDNQPNLPWMHAEVYEHVKTALNLRYRFMPLLYTLAHDAHQTGRPIIAPTFYHFDDEECQVDCDVFMLGPDVLVAPVVDKGAESLRIYLPKTEHGWIDYHSQHHHAGGAWIDVSVTLNNLPVFVRDGAVLPLANHWEKNVPHDATAIEWTAFSDRDEGQAFARLYWDDGLSTNLSETIEAQVTWYGAERGVEDSAALPSFLSVK